MNEENKQEKPATISFFEHEAEVARLERANKRSWIFGLIIFAAFVISNLIWLQYEMQFEDVVTVTQDVDSGSSPAYVNGTGEMTVNGESKTDNNKNP